LLNSNGETRFINLINSGNLGTLCQWNCLESPLNLHQGNCFHTQLPVSLCVSKHKVVQVTHDVKRRISNVIFLSFDGLFVAKDDFAENEILSSTMSKDAEYLILGTTKGIIVIDRFEKKVIFRRNVSDQVLSLDIYRYHDEAMYILSSVFKDAGHVISLHGFNGNRDELAMMCNDMNLLAGEDLFDINKSSHEWQMVAVDNKSNIHFRSSAKDFTESIEKNPFDYHIKKISYNGDKVIVGCTNGCLYSSDLFNQTTLLADLRSEISYLECFDGAIIASCNSVYKIIGIDKEFIGKVTKAYRYKDNEMLLIRKDCGIEIVNLSTGEITLNQKLGMNHSSSAQAYCDSLVAIATEQNFIHLWKIDEDPEAQVDIRTLDVNGAVTALAISPDKNVLAVGYSNGNIEVCSKF
jgi:WD40 repeat protein